MSTFIVIFIILSCFIALYFSGFNSLKVSTITGLAFGMEFIGKDEEFEIFEDVIIIDLAVLRFFLARA